ncbi:class I SAM-dependent methyltransferase [Campylobacter jejuni]|nr:class I SAM-dependent methyltransferase [Campylobacter jejuni]EAL0407806.1 class I SAM-dependent methyltransferase [Campylobacter jejuni]EAL0407816.1 class I SAM-dependent methyltransferase [Campylobacter jejuni]
MEAAVPKDKIGDVKVMNNEYDNEKFFEEYAKMSRSKEGLKAAGEWHQLKPLFPSLEGKSVLDLGCGYGWHCKFAEEQGATKILGIDLSKKMIEEAQKRNSGNQIEYRISGLEEYDYPENEWDCVISNLALHYIEDIVEIFQKVYRTLKPGGIFLFNIEHPVFTAGVGQDWIYTDDGKPQYWAIDNYFITGERNTHFLGCDVVKQHHTLTQIIMGLLNNGFELKVVEEAEPPKEMMDIPGMEDELRRPMLIDLIRIYFQDTAAKGITARNQLIEIATASLSDLMKEHPEHRAEAKQDLQLLNAQKMGEHEAEIEKIKNVFLAILRDIKKDIDNGEQPGEAVTAAMFQAMRDALAEQKQNPLSIDDVAAMVAGQIGQLTPMDEETADLFKQLAKKMMKGIE